MSAPLESTGAVDAIPAGASTPTGRGRLGAYAVWQARDYFVLKGLGTALVATLMLGFSYLGVREARAYGVGAEVLSPLLDRAFREFVSNFVLFGVLFATNGIVAEDRKFGYYRFYFAKPVRVSAFYAQKFGVHFLGFLLVGALLLAAFNVVFKPAVPPLYFPVLACLFLGLGGVGFLLSALTTVDWISLIGLYGVSRVLWELYGASESWRGAAVRVLPPVHRLDEIYAAMAAGAPLPWALLGWITAYGAICFLLGLAVLSRRRLATN